VAARRFFGKLLGLEEIEKPEELRARGGVWFRVSDQQLHIGIEDPFVPARKAHPAIGVSDRSALDELGEGLSGAGFPVRWDEAQGDANRLYTEDPWGNRLEFIASSS
jgi:catechol 2,3-dioxygenase-like lactoylglutathione lyase family enzyme